MEEVDKYFKEEFLQGAEYGKEIKEFYVSNNKTLETANEIGIRDGKGTEGAGKVDIGKALETAQQAHKGGETVAGHALQKHAGRNPDIWGKIKGGADQINQQAMNHINEIINGSGEFKIFTTDQGVQFWEKMLPDGRGIRLNLDGTFKGFIDQIR